MRKTLYSLAIIALTTAILSVSSMSTAQAQDNQSLNALLGTAGGAYLGAEICGGSTAVQVLCGVVGANIGREVFAPNYDPYRQQQQYGSLYDQRRSEIDNARYGGQSSYANQHDYVNGMRARSGQRFSRRGNFRQTRQSFNDGTVCEAITVELPDGRRGPALMCPKGDGSYQLIPIDN